MSATQLLKVNQGPVAVSLFRSSTEFRELLQILIVLFFERLHLCVSRDKVVHSRKVGVFDNRNLRADTDMQARCVSCCHREREFRGADGANRAPSTIRTYAHQVLCPVSMANGRTVPQACKKGEITVQIYYHRRTECVALVAE